MMWFTLGSYASKSCVTPKMTPQGYYYFELPRGRGYKMIWVNRSAIIADEEGNEQIQDWLDYRKTEKGNIVLLPRADMNATVVVLQGQCGYRGHSTLLGDFETIEQGAYYYSPRGSLGVDDVKLAVIKDGDIIKLSRTGRTYGEPVEVTYRVVFGHGGIEIIRADEDSDPELKQLL